MRYILKLRTPKSFDDLSYLSEEDKVSLYKREMVRQLIASLEEPFTAMIEPSQVEAAKTQGNLDFCLDLCVIDTNKLRESFRKLESLLSNGSPAHEAYLELKQALNHG